MTFDFEKYQSSPQFSFLHWEFGAFLARRGKIAEDVEERKAIVLLGAKCLQVVEQGHSCLDLKRWYEQKQETEGSPLPSPFTPEEWGKIIEMFPGIAGQGDSTGAEVKPLLYQKEHQLVYLHKYDRAEIEIAHFIKSRLAVQKGVECTPDQIRSMNTLFKEKKDNDPQLRAVSMALRHHFSILTGGPGTGKTTVLATILAMELNARPQLRIGLAAPTGKAAMQVLESLNDELSTHLERTQLGEGVEEKLRALNCSTIHRMLRIHGATTQPAYNKDNPLPYDLVVIDECSMVSLRLMHQLCDAIPEHCRLLLIGDQNQLAAVDAGSLLGDFCTHCKALQGEEYVTRLIENHRSKANPELQSFVQAICDEGQRNTIVSESLKTSIEALYSGKNPQFRAVEIRKEQRDSMKTMLEKELKKLLKGAVLPARFQTFFGEEKTKSVNLSLAHWRQLCCKTKEVDALDLALAHFYVENFRIICGIHESLFGEKALNNMMCKDIMKRDMGADGTPVIVLQNDPALNLNNGDIGICWNRKVYFPKWQRNESGDLFFDYSKSYSMLQLPPHTLAYAMTIHKSQGSGFDNVIMVLPENDNHVLCRELIYTGISRTKKNFLLWGTKEIFSRSLDRQCDRWSGMANRL